MSTKISARTAASTLTGAETVGIIQGGLDRKCTVADLFAAGDALGSIRDFGCVADNTTDDTTNLQAFFSDSSGKIKVLEDGAYKYTTALTVYSGGVHVVGVGTGGNFLSVLRPSNCAAFDINNVHHSIFEQIMIWPQGGTPPTNLWTVQNAAYSCLFRDIRIHYDINDVPTNVLHFIAPGVNNIVFENLRMRAEGATSFPVGVLCDAACGSVTFRSLDINVADRGVKLLGGHINITDIYTESCGVFTIEIDHSGDANAHLTMQGGLLNVPSSALGIALKDGAKNINIAGTYVSPDAGTPNHVYVYGLSGSSNINISTANFTNARIGAGVALDPTIIKFDVPNRPLPASKYTSINVTVGTLAAGVVTGAQRVRVLSTNATPGTQTTRTAVEMVAELVNCLPGDEYYLEIANTGAGTFTLGAGVGVTVTGTATIAQNTMRSFKVTVDSLTAMTFLNIGSVTYAA
jgi:hypothetical protein